jgi:hypothetical protein
VPAVGYVPRYSNHHFHRHGKPASGGRADETAQLLILPFAAPVGGVTAPRVQGFTTDALNSPTLTHPNTRGRSGSGRVVSLVRRNIGDGDLAFFATLSNSTSTLVPPRGTYRYSFETTKNELNFDYRNTSWHGWYRHVAGHAGLTP